MNKVVNFIKKLVYKEILAFGNAWKYVTFNLVYSPSYKRWYKLELCFALFAFFSFIAIVSHIPNLFSNILVASSMILNIITFFWIIILETKRQLDANDYKSKHDRIEWNCNIYSHRITI